jgi:glycosyltransferase involved in cell wall biosynthesis
LANLIATVSPAIEITVAGVCPTIVNAIAQRRSHSSHIIISDGVGSVLNHRMAFGRVHPDLIHLNLCTPWAGASALTAALSLPSTRVVRVDQLPLRTTDAIALWRTRMLCLRVDAHVAVGEASARRMEDFYALGRDTIISIPNGVPDRGALPPPVRPAGEMIVGSIGRLDAMKGHDVLLQAIAQVEGIRAVILGAGNERTALEKLAVELGIGDRVELPGWVDDPRSYLASFDVVALPSRSEGFPLVMVEAMLAARPVIATRVGSMPEAVIPHETGLLVDKNDSVGLALALRELRDRPDQRLQLGQQARQLALTRFTAETMATLYELLWYRLQETPQTNRLRVTRPKD